HERGAYTLSKVMAEKLVLQELAKDRKNWTVLRPSIIHGPGKTVTLKQIGGFQLTDNLKIVFGSGEKRLRLVRVEDVVEAIYLSIANPKSRGKIYNITDDELISKKEYIEKSMGVDGRNGLTLYIPYPLIYGAVYLQELLFKILNRKAFLTRYRLRASQVELDIDNLLIKQDLGWKPIH
ncbi:MAG: NAD(P)-dependent oxidoreductase, partial [Candidatus Jordarchaeaceae archaeon]